MSRHVIDGLPVDGHLRIGYFIVNRAPDGDSWTVVVSGADYGYAHRTWRRSKLEWPAVLGWVSQFDLKVHLKSRR